MSRRRWISLLLPLVGLVALLVFALVRRGGESEPASAPPSPPPVREDATAPPVAPPPEPARLEGAPAEGPRDEKAVAIRGEVADAEGALLAGVSVRLRILGEVAAETVTDAGGRFHLAADLPPGEGVLYGLVEARHESAGAVLRMLALRSDPAWGERRVPRQQAIGRLVLLPAHAFDVRVVSTCDAAPPARIRVRHGLFHDGPDYVVLDTDARGEAHVEGFGAGTWRLIATAEGCGRGSAFFKLPRPDGAPVEVEIAPPRDVTVEVVDGLTGEAVAGAALDVRERLRRPDGTESASYQPPPAIAPTDANGRTVIANLGEKDELDLVATADGYPAPADRRYRIEGPGTARVGPGATEVSIELVGERTVTWPVEGGEVPVPPDGTEIRILPLAGSRHETPPAGRIVDGTLVVPGWGAGYAVGRAETPDGAIAQLQAGPEDTLGPPIRFHHPRTLEVRLVYPDGEPAEGLYVVATQAGGTPITAPTATDGEGVVRVEDLYGGGFARVDVKISEEPRPYGGFPIGTVNLAEGDATLEHVVHRPREVVVHVRVDGEPRLPPAVFAMVGWSRYGAGDFVRDEQAAVLRLRWRPFRVGATTRVQVSAPDLLPGTAEIPVPEDEEALEATVDLGHGGSLVAEVAPPADDRYRVELQVWDSDRRSWIPASAPNMPRRADEEGEMRFAPLAPGLYRVYERYVGIPSSSAEVSPETGEARVRLDLSHTAIVAGRVEVPEGFSRRHVFVRVLGTEEPPAPPVRGPAQDPREGWVGTITGEAGEFQVRVPGDREVTLRPAAPFLRPAADGGEAVVTGARQDLVLRLETAAVATFRYDREPRHAVNPGQPRVLDVLLYEGEPEGEPAHRLLALLEGEQGRFSGYPAGTFTVWIDARPFAPVVLPGVAFGAGDLDLGTLKTSDGATFLARIETKEGLEPPRYEVAVSREGEPFYFRDAWSLSGGEIRVTGIGPGRFRVSVRPDPTGPSLFETIDFDGESTVERVVK